MLRVRSPSFWFAPWLSCALVWSCNEEPTLDTVGGAGSIAEAGAPSSTAEASAPPPATCDDTGVDPTTACLPAEVDAVFAAKCTRCHTSEEERLACTEAGTCLYAPFPLLTWADTRRALGTPLVYERIVPVTESGFMPLMSDRISPPVEALTDSERQTLIDWVENCAPPGPGDCGSDAAARPADAASPDGG